MIEEESPMMCRKDPMWMRCDDVLSFSKNGSIVNEDRILWKKISDVISGNGGPIATAGAFTSVKIRRQVGDKEDVDKRVVERKTETVCKDAHT